MLSHFCHIYVFIMKLNYRTMFRRNCNVKYFIASRTALGYTQSPIKWVPGALPLGVNLTIHLHLVLRSRMRGAIPLLSHGVVLN
jgi:hypothetical protein